MTIIRTIWSFCYLVVATFFEDECPLRAAALAYTSLLSLVPLMSVSLTILQAFPVVRDLGEKIQNFIFSNFVASSAEVIQKYLQQFAQQTIHLSPVGFLFLILTALLMIYNIEQAFNLIWHIKHRRKGVSAFLLYWAVLTLTPVLIGLGLAISSYLISLPYIAGAAEALGLRVILLPFIPYLLTFTAFTLLYIAVPNCKVPFLGACLGGLISTILFELAKFGFTLYITKFPTYRLLYGALAAIPIFLIWVYLSWLVILFGAVVSRIYTVKTKPEHAAQHC